MTSMSNRCDIQGVEAMDEHIIDASKSFTVAVSAQQRFYQELETAVQERRQYLTGVAEATRAAKLSGWYLTAKRGMDIFVGVIGLILLSPFFLVVAITIKLDSRGPAFFIQERIGRDGKPFMMYKFRTMVTGAEKKTGPVWAAEDDPRLTFMGRIFRKSKVDELPQLINLVKGNMTMVGPRPERPFFVNHFIERIPGYARRLDVLPGITGLAQLRNGYDQDAMDVIRKLQFDITYIEKMSLWMDLRLLVETFMAIFTGKA